MIGYEYSKNKVFRIHGFNNFNGYFIPTVYNIGTYNICHCIQNYHIHNHDLTIQLRGTLKSTIKWNDISLVILNCLHAVHQIEYKTYNIQTASWEPLWS